MKSTPRSNVTSSPSPKARQGLTIKTTKLDDKRSSLNGTPRRAQSPHYQRPSPRAADIQAYDRILFDQLVTLMTCVMKANLVKTSHDASLLQDQVQQRAIESVNEGLSKIVGKLEFVQGPSPSHRMTACIQLFNMLMDDINLSVFNDDKHRINVMRKEQNNVKEEANRVHESLTLKIAKKDQQISTLEYDLAMSETKNKTLAKAIELLEKELEKAQQSISETHQRAVELRMQGWDFKYEVDRRSEKILDSVSSRMGFVPAGIQKQVASLKVLKPPGDPDYDMVRNQGTRSRRAGKKKSKNASGANSNRNSTDNLMMAALIGGSPAGTQITVSKYAITPTPSEDNIIAPSKSSLNAPTSPASVARAGQQYQQFLLNSAEKDFKDLNVGGRRRLGIAEGGVSPDLHEHRRLSASSNASGYTDRRSSTTSNSSSAPFASMRSLEISQVPVEPDDGEIGEAEDDVVSPVPSGDVEAGDSNDFVYSGSGGVKYRDAWAHILKDTKPFTTGEITALSDSDFILPEETERDAADDNNDDDGAALDEDYEQFDSKVYELEEGNEDSSSDEDEDDDEESEVEEVVDEEARKIEVNKKVTELSAAIAAATKRVSRLEESYESRVSRSKDTAGAAALRSASGSTSQSPSSSNNRKKLLTASS